MFNLHKSEIVRTCLNVIFRSFHFDPCAKFTQQRIRNIVVSMNKWHLVFRAKLYFSNQSNRNEGNDYRLL